MMNGDLALVGRSLEDVMIEPQRAKLIPMFYEVKEAAMKAGALGCSISGAGPSIFAFSEGKETAEKVSTAMKKAFHAVGIKTNAFVSTINQNGPKVIG